jgi:carboxyl-terminal processing protease
VRGLTLTEAVDKMRGLVNTPITLTILREGVDRPIEITIVRDIIKVKAVKFRIEGDVGYMKITSFTEKTQSDLEDAIARISSEIPPDRLKGYVLDLRLNPGGLLDQAISVSDSFLDNGEIVSTRGREASDITRFDAQKGDLLGGKPLVVLVNGGSASASEIVAGALQDQRRATIVGSRTFGKGSVQTIIPLGANGALRLTTALYYTPAGRSIQGTGIVPDIAVEQPLPEDLAGLDTTRGESALRGHIKGEAEGEEGSGSSAFVPQDPKDDKQLAYALELLRGERQHAAFPPDPNRSVLNQ